MQISGEVEQIYQELKLGNRFRMEHVRLVRGCALPRPLTPRITELLNLDFHFTI